MFLDRVKIKIKAGNGGNGIVSLLHTALTQYGGPDGGDGGRGGDVYIRGKSDLSTLYSFKFQKKFVAEDGGNGQKGLKHGKDGADVYVDVPLGTVVYDESGENIVIDITKDGQTYKILSGGRGGFGNAHFKSSTRQTPRFSQSGEPTEMKEVLLELKVMADVGIAGFPNVGKSTLLSVISSAKPKIANYHFTTLEPNLGVVSYKDVSFTVADIPGLIEGASEGTGLGHYFLKHLERVRLIVHMVDISGSEGRSPAEDYKTINNELRQYNQRLSTLEQIIVMSKCDLLEEADLNKKVAEFKKQTGAKEVFPICSIIHEGVDVLVSKIAEKLSKIPKVEGFESEVESIDVRDKSSINIDKLPDGSFYVWGGRIDNLIRGVVLSDDVSFMYFQKRIKEAGIIDQLKEKGLKEGDVVSINDITFEYFD